MSEYKERIAYGFGSLAAGLLYWWLLTFFWAHWVAVNPIATALLQPGNVQPYYRWVLYPTDWLASVIVSVPFAVALVWLARRHLWLCVAVASASCLLTVDWTGLANPPSLLLAVARGVLLQLTFLPAAVWLVLLIKRRFAPNNSFKPKPLRGSA